MNRLPIIVIAFTGLITIHACSPKKINLTKVWETQDVFLGPESIVYDEARGLLYVSNVNIREDANSDDSINVEFISKVDLEGNLIDLTWISDINRPTGITIYQDKLYVTERYNLLIVDIESGTIEQRIPIENAGFPNDVTVDEDGVVYITDSATNTVYRIKNGKVESWLVGEEIAAPNGILYDNGKLIIGVNRDNYLKSIDLETKEIQNIAFLGEGEIDGIVKYGKDFLVSHVKGNLYRVTLDGEVEELLNTRENDIRCADFGFVEHERMIIAPVINKGRLTAYQF